MGSPAREGETVTRQLTTAEAGRVDAIVAAAFPELSRARVQRLIADGHVSVNGESVRKSAVLHPGDRIDVSVPEVVHTVVPSGVELAVLYEDDELIAVNKPAGLSTHGGPDEAGPTVAAWMLERLGDRAGAFDADHPGVVHRLDKDTTGVLVLAKTPKAQAGLSAEFEARTSEKTYLALCDGVPRLPRGVIDAPIGRHPGDRTRMAVIRRGRDASTAYEVLASARGKALIEARPKTGRTHQIRVHLAAINAPVSRDRVYGRGDGSSRQLLHAWRLRIPHPDGGTLEVTTPVPDDFRAAAIDAGFERACMPYWEPSPPRREREST